jgi:hypothetical protein
VEVAVAGSFATFSGNLSRSRSRSSPVLFLNGGAALDGYEVVLTDRRLLAFRVGSRGPKGDLMEQDRREARAALERRGRLFDRLQVGFGGGSLSISVHRVLRADVTRLLESLRDSSQRT